MAKNYSIEIVIDKLTHSVENAVTGDTFKTSILKLAENDIKLLKNDEWHFDWKSEAKQTDRLVYKLVIRDNDRIIQGLVSLQDRGDHIFISLIESNKFNQGTGKVYLGVPGNLVGFACKLSFEKGYQGYVSFESKTKLKEHYQQTLGAHILFGNMMAIDTIAALKLIEQYFPENQ